MTFLFFFYSWSLKLWSAIYRDILLNFLFSKNRLSGLVQSVSCWFDCDLPHFFMFCLWDAFGLNLIPITRCYFLRRKTLLQNQRKSRWKIEEIMLWIVSALLFLIVYFYLINLTINFLNNKVCLSVCVNIINYRA